MKNFINILRCTAKRSKMAVLSCVVLGIFLCVFYNMIAGMYNESSSGVKIGLAVYNETDFTNELKAYLRDDLNMTLIESTDYDYLSGELVQRGPCGIIEITDDEVTVTFLGDYANAAFVTAYLNNFISAYKNNPSARAAAIPLTVTSVNDGSDAKNQQDAFRDTIGFYLNFAMIIGMFLAFQVADDRKLGVYRRLKASGIRAVPYVAGVCLAGVLCSLVQAAIFLAYMTFNHITTGVSLPLTLLLCTLFSMFSVGFSLLFGVFVKTRMSLIAGIVGGSTVLSILGGAYFPLDMSPAFMQKLAHISPPYWFTTTIENAQNGGDSWALGLTALALFAALMFILSGIKFACDG